MSHVMYDGQWRRAMVELTELLQAEAAPAAWGAPGAAALYLRYAALLRTLDEVHERVRRPADALRAGVHRSTGACARLTAPPCARSWCSRRSASWRVLQ